VIESSFSFRNMCWVCPETGFHSLSMLSIDVAYEYLFSVMIDDWVLIVTCKQLVWSNRIGRNMPIWILCLRIRSGTSKPHRAMLQGHRYLGVPDSRLTETFAPQVSTSWVLHIPTLRTHTSNSVQRCAQVPPPLCSRMWLHKCALNNI